MKKLGLIVNPVAGMGGRVGLKGSDGADVLRRARELGAEPESPRRAVQALRAITAVKELVEVVTYPGDMGEEEAAACGLSPTVIGSVSKGSTTAEDTRRAAKDMEGLGVDLVLFAGGDGTARDVYSALGQRVPALGIPTGVKIHSAVYAVSPRHAGEVAAMFLGDRLVAMRDAEVMDIDEEAFRRGTVSAKLYGYLRTPEEQRLVQGVKSGGGRTESEALSGIAGGVVRDMEQDCLYVIGPGTTTRAIMEELGVENTLLGVDVVLNRALVATDVNEAVLLALMDGRKAKIVVTVIGGQGYIFGRGNQQISPTVLRRTGRENVIVIATAEKLTSLGGKPLLVDTGDPEMDRSLSGYMRVVTGFNETFVYKVED